MPQILRPRQRLLPAAALGLVLALTLAACGGDDGEEVPATTTTTGGQQQEDGRGGGGGLSFTDVATGLEVPWGIDFLPNGDALVSERDSGRILRLDPATGETTEEQTIDVDPAGEGGLLGIAVSPDYERDNLVYAYYTTESDNRIARFELGAEPEPILTGIGASTIHNGGRLAFGPDGRLYASTGDAGNAELAQNRNALNGKILRMTPEGKAPGDNPFSDSLVYSLGHRNVEGLAFDADGRLYASEFGADGSDELNRIEAAGNYGWPIVEGEGGEPEFIDPITTWNPDEASPAGIEIVGGDLSGFEDWRGDVLVATLSGERLWRVALEGDGARVAERAELLADELGRLRTILTTPDGELWLATSNRDGRGDPSERDDRIVRLERGS